MEADSELAEMAEEESPPRRVAPKAAAAAATLGPTGSHGADDLNDAMAKAHLRLEKERAAKEWAAAEKHAEKERAREERRKRKTQRKQAAQARMDEVDAMLADELGGGGGGGGGAASAAAVAAAAAAVADDETSTTSSVLRRRAAEIDDMIATELRTTSPLQAEKHEHAVDPFGLMAPKAVAAVGQVTPPVAAAAAPVADGHYGRRRRAHASEDVDRFGDEAGSTSAAAAADAAAAAATAAAATTAAGDGGDDDLRVCSFGEGPLGLGVRKLPDGSFHLEKVAGAAAGRGLARGDTLVAVGDLELSPAMTKKEVVQILRDMPRPFTARFRPFVHRSVTDTFVR